MNSTPEITIVIVNLNDAYHTTQCLDSIYADPPRASFEIVLVDNASTDGSADLLEAKYPQVKLVRSKVNTGIAGGNNLGIRAGSGRYVLLLNNDTVVLPGTIDCVADFLNTHPEAGGVGGILINPDGSFQAGAQIFPSLTEEFYFVTKFGHLARKYFPSYIPPKDQLTVDWLSTAFMLFQREALESVGLVDEDYFIYSDEVDLEYKMWKAGWKIYFLPEIKTIHFGGKSMHPWRSRVLKYRGILMFFRKHHHPLKETVVRLLFFLASTTKLFIWSVVFLFPRLRSRASHELHSNIDIFKLSVWPVLPPPRPTIG